ncbi:MAG: hypothetical protein Q7N50_11350 [Armatimonadota bacterium]|nr:hypothetical protein [Armatimonadota bacterium]
MPPTSVRIANIARIGFNQKNKSAISVTGIRSWLLPRPLGPNSELLGRLGYVANERMTPVPPVQVEQPDPADIRQNRTTARAQSWQAFAIEYSSIVVGQVVALLCSLWVVKILTSRLNSAQYGELALGLTLGGLATQLCYGPLQQATLRYFAPSLEADSGPSCYFAVKSILKRLNVYTAVVGAGFVIAIGVTFSEHWGCFAAAAILVALLGGNERVVDAFQASSRNRLVVASHQILWPVLRGCFAITLIHLFGASSTAAMSAFACASVVLVTSQIVAFRTKFRRVVNPHMHSAMDTGRWRQRLKEYAWPFATWGLFSWLQQSSDRWAIQITGDTQNVGKFAVLSQLGYAPTVLGLSSVVAFIQPIIFSRAGEGRDQERLRSARRINLVIVIGFLLATVLGVYGAFSYHAEIFRMLTGPAFNDTSYLLPWMVLSAGLYSTSEAASMLFMSSATTKKLVAPKIVLSILGTVFNYCGAYLDGIRGVVCASLLFSCISILWVAALALKVSREAHAA